ncbi:MAG: O-antigen ligase family protein [Candidatus Kerfeldbacteria bacterium]|nr:O-antigen ligase family protein [Candidatus Kerfeldbacteria bacterium]
MTISLNQVREYGFYLLVFILPWQTRWIIRDPLISGGTWEYGRISLYAWDVLLVILLIISLLKIWPEIKNFKFLIFNFKSNFKSIFQIFKSPVLTYFLLLLFTLTSVLWAGDKALVFYWVGRLMEGGVIWLWLRALKPKLEYILLSLSLAGVVQAVWAIGQFVTQSTFASKWLGVAIHPITQYGTSVVLTDVGRWLRAYGGQVHPNVLGGLLVITCLATVWLYFNKNFKFQNPNVKSNPKSEIIPKAQNPKLLNSYSYLLFYIIQLVGLFFTFSRGAWLALFITLIFYLIIPVGKYVQLDKNPYPENSGLNERQSYFIKQSLVVLGYTFLVFITLGVVLWQPTVGRILGGSRLEVKSVTERVTSVSDSGSVIAKHWLGGVGMGNYTYALQQSVPSQPANYYQPVHNTFLLIMAELGIIGLGLILWLIKRVVFSSQFIIRNSLFLIPILITALFDHYWWTIPSMFLLLWLILGVFKKADWMVD